MAIFTFFTNRKHRQLAKKGFARKKTRRQEPEVNADHSQRWLTRRGFIWGLMLTLVWAGTTASIVYRRTFASSSYVVGQLADRNIYSELHFEYEDHNQSRELREQAKRQVPSVYVLQSRAQEALTQELATLKQLVQQDVTAISGRLGQDSGSQAERAFAQLSADDKAALEYLFNSDDRQRFLLQQLQTKLSEGVIATDELINLTQEMDPEQMVYVMDTQQRLSRRQIRELKTPVLVAEEISREVTASFAENAVQQRQMLHEVLPKLITANLLFDWEATEKERNKRAANVAPAIKVWPADRVLLKRGERVTAMDLARLERHQEELRSRRSQQDALHDLLSFSALCLVLLLGAIACLHIVFRPALYTIKNVLLIALLVLLQVLLTRATADFYYTYRNTSIFLFPILPLAFGSMVLSPLLGMRVALVAGFYTSVIAALQNGFSMHVLLISCCACIVGSILIRRARRRYHALRAGIAVAAAVFIVDAILLLSNGIPLPVLLQVLVLSLINGIVTATVVSTIQPLFEFGFGMTTDISLLELSDLNHPLLRRLQMEAPGTYHHSLMVATIAEHAAEVIGANPLLTRVCAYFHDIGKLDQPEYFTENTAGISRHDGLEPRMSSLIILNHVKNGIDLALRHKLKKPIREAIAQHHGTSIVYYFYNRARSRPDGQTVGEHDYRYPGPLPQRKEIVLVSLADACEAATRSLEKPTSQKITAQVNDIVMTRISTGQLDRADLTMEELAMARQTIASTLACMLHGRVSYPQQKSMNEDRSEKESDKAAAEQAPAAAQSNATGFAPDGLEPAAGATAATAAAAAGDSGQSQ